MGGIANGTGLKQYPGFIQPSILVLNVFLVIDIIITGHDLG